MAGSEVAQQTSAELLERVVVGGNLANLSSRERLAYYKAVCDSVGLNPLSRPFDYLTLNGKLTLYATRTATDQLRTMHGVSVERLEREVVEGIYCVTAYAKDAKGRTDSSLGAVSIEGLKGEARANAMMKSETKAKRRVTLSICGLGMLDETEVDSIPGAMVGEPHAPTWPADDTSQDAADRSRLVDQIDESARALKFMKSDYKKAWDSFVGHGIRAEDAPIAKLMALADDLATRLKQKAPSTTDPGTMPVPRGPTEPPEAEPF